MSNRIKVNFSPNIRRLGTHQALAYAAGFFDGEGCVSIVRQLKKQAIRGYIYRLVVCISQNHLRSLADFQNLVGLEGRIYQNKRQGTSNRDGYALIYDGASAARLLQELEPYLLRKHDEALVALKFQDETLIHRHFGPKGCPASVWAKRDALYNKLRKLK